MRKELPDTALKYILEALVPYTDANLKLGFHPGRFFDDLERIGRKRANRHKGHTHYSRQTLRNEFYKARKKGLIQFGQDDIPRLTELGKQKLVRYKPKKLGDSAYIMVTFDIPEEERGKRRHLRLLLKELYFTEVQQSVWVSEFDHRDYIRSEIKALSLQEYVHIYECVKLN